MTAVYESRRYFSDQWKNRPGLLPGGGLQEEGEVPFTPRPARHLAAAGAGTGPVRLFKPRFFADPVFAPARDTEEVAEVPVELATPRGTVNATGGVKIVGAGTYGPSVGPWGRVPGAPAELATPQVDRKQTDVLTALRLQLRRRSGSGYPRPRPRRRRAGRWGRRARGRSCRRRRTRPRRPAGRR